MCDKQQLIRFWQ